MAIASNKKRDPVRPNGDDPYLSFRFHAVIDGISKDHSKFPIAGFSEISGLSVENDVHTLREGGVNEFEHQFTGPAKYSTRLTLKRGLGDETQLWEWYKQVLNGQVLRRDVTIKLLDRTSNRDTGVRESWKFSGAVPVKWTGPTFNAGTSEVAFYTLELVHRGLVLR